MKDSTLILRHFPSDQTPGWVGNPAHRQGAAPALAPPWAELTPVPFDIRAEETACGIELPAPCKLRLVFADPSLRAELGRDRRWRGALEGRARAGDAASESRAVCELLAKNAPTERGGLAMALAAGPRRGGPPIEVLSGELELELDPIERLRSTVAAVLPFASTDRDLALALHDAKALLRALPVAPDRVAEATGALWRALPRPEEEVVRLRKQIDKGLVARRAFRQAMGAAGHVHATMLVGRDSTRLPCFVHARAIESAALAPRIVGRAFVALSTSAAAGEGAVIGWVLAFAKMLDANTGHTSCESVTP